MMKKKVFPILIIFSLYACGSQLITQEEKEGLISELEYIRRIDQNYASIPSNDFINKYGSKKMAWEAFERKRDSVGLENQKKIKRLFKKYGYLGYDKVGKEASDNFWISIQHADNDVKFQKRILDEMKKEVEKNNVSRSSYALLEDRVNKNLGKKQRFGTQVTYNKVGQAIPEYGVVDSINIDKLRKEFDLPLYKVYLNQMTESHYKMNEKSFLEKGIHSPNLYQ